MIALAMSNERVDAHNGVVDVLRELVADSQPSYEVIRLHLVHCRANRLIRLRFLQTGQTRITLPGFLILA
jgi:hypothetical protein